MRDLEYVRGERHVAFRRRIISLKRNFEWVVDYDNFQELFHDG